MAQKSDRVLYIQTTYLMVEEQTIKREYSALESISDNYEKMIVSMDDLVFSNNKGIKHIQVWNLSEIL